MKNIKLLIADDHTMVRMGLVSLLETQADFEIVGEAEDGDSAVAEAVRLRPDIILLDLMMPFKDGVAATAEIRKLAPEVKVVILTSSSSSDYIARAIEAGAAGAILKSADLTSLAMTIRRIAGGETVISPEVQQIIDEDPPVPRMTPRQEEILRSVMRGLTNADIALQFGIRESSVKEHVGDICQKLGAANRAEAVTIALRKQLLKL